MNLAKITEQQRLSIATAEMLALHWATLSTFDRESLDDVVTILRGYRITGIEEFSVLSFSALIRAVEQVKFENHDVPKVMP